MNTDDLRKQLKSESGEIHWQELEKHFARGAVRVVSSKLDLINIAIDIAENNTIEISKAVTNKSITEPSDSEAQNWHKLNTRFLSVVVAPFVLIQEQKVH